MRPNMAQDEILPNSNEIEESSSVYLMSTAAENGIANGSITNGIVKNRDLISMSKKSEYSMRTGITAPGFYRDVFSTRFAIFNGQEHFRPAKECTEYYAPLSPVDLGKQPPRICAVVYPFFNENKNELKRSLQGMHKQSKELDDIDVQCHVVAIMDGWWKASDDMKEYLKEMFPANNTDGTAWWEHIIAVPETSNVVETYILQRTNIEGYLEKVDIGNNNKMFLSLIIKRENRRKHNSHEWFFQSFCPAYGAEYAFATDCGTLYADKCLYYLIRHMDKHPECAAATGRQRVMSAAMQGAEGEGFLAMWYRASQCYDYEASISSFQGAFALVGLLPVLPGPCGLYRMQDIAGECLEYYFEVVNIPPENQGMIAGNLLLAEDRILSYAASLKTGKFTTWVPHAVFYFEAETVTATFVAQRRRWTNGSFAGYIYLILIHPGLLLNSNHSWHFKFMSAFLLFMQLLMFMLVSMAPSIFMSMAYFSVQTINFTRTTQQILQYTALIGYIVLYLVFISVHFFNKFVPWVYYLALFINVSFLISILVAIIVAIISGDVGVLAIVTLSMFTPFILSFLHSVESFVLMVTNFFPFMFFLPTFIAWFAAYAFSRTWDLSWGNRPSDGMDGQSIEKRNSKLKGLKRRAFILNYSLALLNVAAGLGLTHGLELRYFLWLSLAIAMPSFIQMVLSLLFYLMYMPHYTAKGLWKKFGKNSYRALGAACTLCCLMLNAISLSTSQWLERPGTLIEVNQANGSYLAAFGLLRLCITIPQGIQKQGSTEFEIFPGDYCGTYGRQLIRDWPTGSYAFLVVILIVATLFIAISALAMTIGNIHTDTSRYDAISSMYMTLASFLLFIVVLIYPIAWQGAKLTRTDGIHRFISDMDPMCGLGQAYFNPGACSLGFGYPLLIVSLILCIVAAYCFKYMRRVPSRALAVLKRKILKRNRQAEQEPLLQSRIQQLEDLVLRAHVVQDIILEDIAEDEALKEMEEDDIDLC